MEKTKKRIIKTAFFSIIITIIYELINKFVFNNQSEYFIDKIIVDTMIVFFVSLHFVVGFSNLYDFIIRHRYKIAGILLILFTILQYSGSSNGVLVNWVFETEKDNTLFGVPRSIRSDEYGLETLLAVSQKNNNYGYINEEIRGTSTDVFSVVHAPVRDIVSIGKLHNIIYLLFNNNDMGISFYWNIRFFAILLISYELCYIITNKNKKISIIGTIIITFSSVVQWCFSNALIDIIIYGEMAIVLLNKFLSSPKFRIRVLCLIGITISAISYVFTFYPPYMISFGYVFFALAIWVIIKNIKQYKICVKDVVSILGCITVIIFICCRYFNLSAETLEIIKNTSYPGERLKNGGNGINYLFSYLYNFLLPYMNLEDNCSLASVISIFPIPMIIAIIYLYKKEKHISFLLPLSIVAVLETVYCLSGFPEIISKLTLFNYAIVERVAVAVGFANVYLMLYMLANIDEEIVSIKSSIRLSILLIIIVAFIPLPKKIATRGYLSLISTILCMYSFLFLNYYDSRYKKVLLSSLVIFTLIGAFGVNPITKGTYAVTNTDFAQKIQEISKQDENGLWISLNDIMVLSNYAVANGAKTLNSTNIYPNEEFFESVLGKDIAENNKEIWNRYAHIVIELGNKNSIELLEKDKIKLYITPEKLKELNIKYIISYGDKENLLSQGIKVEELYKKESLETVYINNNQVNQIGIYKIIDN